MLSIRQILVLKSGWEEFEIHGASFDVGDPSRRPILKDHDA
jgi:hypothetical protein